MPPIPLPFEVFGLCNDNFEDILVGNGGGGKEFEDEVEVDEAVENLGVLAGVLGIGISCPKIKFNVKNKLEIVKFFGPNKIYI